MEAKILYDFREKWEFCSGTDLHEFFRAQLDGEPSPSGYTEIDDVAADKFVQNSIESMEWNNDGWDVPKKMLVAWEALDDSISSPQPFACDECGFIPTDQIFIPVQWASGVTGSVGLNCCGHLFEDEPTVSEDGMAFAHWLKNPPENGV